MSGQEDSAEKSFEPTPRKLEEARRKGDIARATDLNAAAAYLGFLVLMAAGGAGLALGLAEHLAAPLAGADRGLSGALGGGGGAWALGLAALALPFWAAPAILVVGSLAAQRAVVFAPSKLAPKLQRISPLSNAGNKFGPTGLFEFAKSTAKLIVLSITLFLFLLALGDQMIGAVLLGPRAAMASALAALVGFWAVVTVIAGAIAMIDMAWQAHDHRRKLRMTRQEVLDEAKSSEGDPHLKQARRQRGRDIATNRMMSEVPGADVVIVNPVHVAVALRWSRARGSAPVCVALGQGEIALRIREIAAEAGVPIRHDPPTARALFATVELGQEVPPALYAAVAAAIRFAEDLRRRAGAGSAGGARAPARRR
ncbi:MAG: EscU/YscU/HrcU family type III secretion system export apparatus switch protein [Rhodobacteraceae bacterium]|nr:EscU/YscU/HrcU family type III secretion system export apparatus switch protein [Paracoccaceae bacterium]